MGLSHSLSQADVHSEFLLIFPVSTPLYLVCLHMSLRPSSPPPWDTHLPQRGHGYLSRNCVVCLYKFDEPQSYILPSLQSLFHQLNITSTVPLPILKPCCSSPNSHSTILFILRPISLSNTFSNVIHRDFPGSRTSSFLFHTYTIDQVRHSSWISPSFIQVFNKRLVHLTPTRSAISSIYTRISSIPDSASSSSLWFSPLSPPTPIVATIQMTLLSCSKSVIPIELFQIYTNPERHTLQLCNHPDRFLPSANVMFLRNHHSHLSLLSVTVICHCYLSLLPVTLTCLCYLSLLPVTLTCHCYMSLLPATVNCHCYMSLLPLTVTCHCYLPLLIVTVPSQCYLSLLPVTVICHCYLSLLPITVTCH